MTTINPDNFKGGDKRRTSEEWESLIKALKAAQKDGILDPFLEKKVPESDPSGTLEKTPPLIFNKSKPPLGIDVAPPSKKDIDDPFRELLEKYRSKSPGGPAQRVIEQAKEIVEGRRKSTEAEKNQSKPKE